MKANKLIKAFIPYAVNDELWKWCGKAVKNPDKVSELLKNFIGKDPDDHEWSYLGMIEPVGEDSLVHNLDGAASLLLYQFAERKLPASVRDEKIAERHKELSIQQGRPLNKKEYAQLKEDVESQLLPQAFVVRKFIPVLVTSDTLLVCTSSASMAEKILGHLSRMCNTRKITIEFRQQEFGMSYGALLGQIARDGQVQQDDDDDIVIHAGTTAKFVGEDKRTITIKDRDLQSEEVNQITNGGSYACKELRVHLEINGGEGVSEFTITDKAIFKGFKLTDVSLAGINNDTDDLHATYWLLAKEALRAIDGVCAALGEVTDNAEAAEDEEI